MGVGTSTSAPVQSHPDSYVVIAITVLSKIRVMNGTPAVRALLERLNAEMDVKSNMKVRGPVKDYYGTLKMKPGPWKMFVTRSGKEAGTLGKYFCLRLFEEMYKIGYNLIMSSDLARFDDFATWFFSKNLIEEDRSDVRICCIATGGLRLDKLILFHHDECIKATIISAIGDAWPKGIDSIEDINVVGETLHEIKLNGIWGWTHEDGVNTRRLICNIVGRMGGINWRLLTATNIKGTADSYFFIYDPTFKSHPSDFCMITLSRRDRFRLINCNEMAEQLKQVVTAAGQVIQREDDYYGCHEIKVAGNPWWSSGNEAIQAQRTISRILEMMCRNSWNPYYAIDVSRSLTDKTSILFKRSPFPTNIKYACISMTDANKMKLLDFTLDVGVPLRNVVYEQYPFGVSTEVNLPDSNLQLKLNDMPWIGLARSKGCSNYHARAMLGRMMKVGEDYGWYPVISADVSAKHVSTKNNHYSVDVHTIYFMKMMN